MKRDNPHISKRRGGRKTGHRKFSLQAFHAKHLIHHNSHQTAVQQPSNEPISVASSSEAASETQGRPSKLPTLIENDSSIHDGMDADEPGEENKFESTAGRQVEMDRLIGDDGQQEQRAIAGESHHSHMNKQHNNTHYHNNHHNKYGHHRNYHDHGRQHAWRHQKQFVKSKTKGNDNSLRRATEPTSQNLIDGVICYDADDALILNESQSSPNDESPQGRTLFVYNQSYVQPDDPSVN